MNQQLHVNTEDNIRQGMVAIRGVIRSHVDDYRAMFRADIGNVAFYWGKEGDATSRFLGGYGLSKIIAEKGDDVITDIVKTVARGRITRRHGASLSPRLLLEYQGASAVMALASKGKNGESDTWLLAEWIDLGEGGYTPVHGERPFADVVPGVISTPEPVATEQAITEAAASGDWKSLKGIFEKPIAEYVPGMFMESVGDDPFEEHLRKVVIATFNTYAVPYLKEAYRWTDKDAENYVRDESVSVGAIEGMIEEAKKYFKSKGVDLETVKNNGWGEADRVVLEDPITPAKKVLMDEYWLLASDLYPFAGKTRAQFDETVQWWPDEKIQEAITSRKVRAAKFSESTKALQSANSFQDIWDVFRAAFGSAVNESSFSQFEDSAEKAKNALAMLKDSGASPEARYFAMKQLDVHGNRNALKVSGIDREAVVAEFGEDSRNKAKLLLDGYVSRGQQAIIDLGLADVLAQRVEVAAKRGELTEAHAKIYSEIRAIYEPKEAEAGKQYVTPLVDEMTTHRKEYDIKRQELNDRRPRTIGYVPPSSPKYDEWLDEMEKVAPGQRDWLREMEKLNEDSSQFFSDFAKKIQDANARYVTPISEEKWAKLHEATDPINDQISALTEKNNIVVKEAYAKTINHLLEQSPVSKEQADTWIKQNALMDKKAIAKARKAGYAPEDVQKDLAEFYRLTGGRLSRLEYTTIKQSRSAAAHWSGKLYVGSSFGKKTFFHELAHLLEEDPKIVDTARAFLEKRRESSTVFSLSSLTGNKNYKRDEGAYRDSWHDPYVGKVYSNATEVISMGMQMISSPEALLSLQEKDAEHLALILGICTSKPYVDESIVQLKQGDIQQKKQVAQKTEDVFKNLDKKIVKAGDFWSVHNVELEPYIKWRHTKPSYWYAYWPDPSDSRPGVRKMQTFKSEKLLKRALYLWVANGMQMQGPLSLFQLGYDMKSGDYLPAELLDGPVPDITQ